jgi:hypothetical protein
MGFLDLFRRSKPPITDVGQLADFIDEQSAFLVQKGIYDYTRARSGHFAKVMLADKGFQDALDRSRWRAYPLGLAMVGETIEGMLAVQSMEDRRATLDALIKVVLSVFDRYPKPDAVSDEEWTQARADLALHLQRLSTHPPKRVIDIPEPFAARYFALMPFDKQFLTPDAPTARSFLQLQLVAMQEELLKRMDSAKILQDLRQSSGGV